MTSKVFAVIVSVFTVPFFVSAQTAPASSPPNGGEGAAMETVVVAEVEIYEARILSQDKNSFRIGFDIHNGAGAQPQIRYKVELVEKQRVGDRERQVLHDTEFYDKVVSLGENASVSENIRYDAPEFLSGTYEILIIAENENGLPLGRATLNTVTLSGSGRYLAAEYGRCFLSVENDKLFENGKKLAYPLLFGVDILPTEALYLTCLFENKLGKDVTVRPSFLITERSTYGKQAPASGLNDTQPVSFTIGEKKMFRTRVPMVAKPQSYDAYMTLNDERGDAVSETVKAHFVVRGESATIQNAVFDKSGYAVGDTATIRFFWSPSADDFPGSRFEGGTAITGGATVYAVLKNGSGASCAEPLTAPLSEERIDTVLSFPVSRDCADPTASLTIKNASGTVLAAQEMGVATLENGLASADKKGKEDQDVARSLASALLLVSAIAGVAIVGIALARKRRKGPRLPLVSLFVLVCAGMFAGGLQSADALTISSVGRHENIIANVGLDKGTYVSGESIVASGSVSYTNCANQPWGWYYLNATHGSDTKPVIATTAVATEFTLVCVSSMTGESYAGEYSIWDGSYTCFPDDYYYGMLDSSDFSSGSTTFTATPSITSIQFYALGWRSDYSWGASGTINYSVTAPGPVNGACGFSDGAVLSSAPASGLCSAGTSSGVSGSGPWTWTCPGQNGGTTASCSASLFVPAPTVDLKINGSDGPVNLIQGATKNITWTTNATSCTASSSDGFGGAKSVPSGLESLTANTTSNHTLTCSGPGGITSDSVQVNVFCTPITGAYGACQCPQETKSRTNVSAACVSYTETVDCTSTEKNSCRDFNWKEVAP